MVRAGEHVHGLHGFNAEVPGRQVRQIPGQGGRVARYVDDFGRFHFGDGRQHPFLAAGAGRVEDDHVGAHAFLHEAGHFHCRVAEQEIGVFNMVGLGVLFRVADSRRHDFDADGEAGLLRQEQRDGSRAAIEVDDVFAAFQIRQFQGFAVQFFHLLAVDLEEGLGRNVEFQVSDLVFDGRFAVDQVRLFAEDDVRAPFVNVLHDALEARNGRL